MEPEMDEERTLAKIERRLTREDPGLASLMDTLNQQFPEGHEHDRKRWNWRKTAVVVLAVLALAGLLLTAVLVKPSADGKPASPNGLAPAVSVHVQRRDRRSRTPPGDTSWPSWKQTTDPAPEESRHART
jgi:hypothetical protein